MSTFSVDERPPSPSHKGKRRAEDPTEHTPLLPSASPSSSSYVEDDTRNVSGRSLRARLTFIFVTSLSFCITTFIVLGLLAYSYASKGSSVSVDTVIKNAVVFRGPDRVDVLNVTSSGDIWVGVDARVGVDAGSIIGVKKESEDGFFLDMWKTIGRWGIRRLDSVSFELSTVKITSEHGGTSLASVLSQPLTVPLTPDAPPRHDLSWLANFSTVLLIQPASNASALVEFLRDSWRHGAVEVQVDVQRASIKGGNMNEETWRHMLHKVLFDIRQSIQMRIPPLPGLPQPGHQVPFPPVTELITVKSFDVSSGSNELNLHAIATLIDPAPPTFNLTSPSFPFTISLPPSNVSTLPLHIASVYTAPFSLTHPNITLDISGKVLPLAKEAASTLSSVASRYLSHQPNPILITSPLVPGLSIEAVFPAPDPPPRILRNVTIRDMKVKPGTTLLASGTIFARIVLPKGVNVDLDVSKVLPDVLVFDGAVPEDALVPRTDPPEPARLPDPLPERAFGHIRPADWLNASSVHAMPEEGEGSAYTVAARIVDVPLEVLPGRQKEFSNFVGKVIFGSGGAVAGILGSAAVSVKVQGLPLSGSDGEVELSGLPFRGSVLIRKKAMFEEDVLEGDEARRTVV